MSNNDARELAMKSLVYFCFGITLEEDESTIIDSIVSKAYFDATQQGAFNTLLSDEGMKESADAAKKSVRDSIVEKLSVFKAHKDIKSYDDWHESICTDVLKKYKDINDGQERFTYGNAQKILNMTMKYLYMLANIYGDECQNQELRELFSEIKEIFKKIIFSSEKIFPRLTVVYGRPMKFEGSTKDKAALEKFSQSIMDEIAMLLETVKK